MEKRLFLYRVNSYRRSQTVVEGKEDAIHVLAHTTHAVLAGANNAPPLAYVAFHTGAGELIVKQSLSHLGPPLCIVAYLKSLVTLQTKTLDGHGKPCPYTVDRKEVQEISLLPGF